VRAPSPGAAVEPDARSARRSSAAKRAFETTRAALRDVLRTGGIARGGMRGDTCMAQPATRREPESADHGGRAAVTSEARTTASAARDRGRRPGFATAPGPAPRAVQQEKLRRSDAGCAGIGWRGG